MATRCEIAFKALDMNNSGYITAKHIKKLTPKMNQEERDALVAKVLLQLGAVYLRLQCLPTKFLL